MGKQKAPKPDAAIGEAALKSAQTGEDYLKFMRGQAAITNGWAAEDRTRAQTVFQPMEDALIADANNYDTPERREAAATAAGADVREQSAISRGISDRRMASMGVNPASGRFAGEERRGAASEALMAAGAENLSRRQTEATGRALKADVVNMGRGMAVNPGTSMGLSNGAASSGFNGAMSGYGQQGNLLNTQYNQQMASWQANQGAMGSLGGAFGSVLGAFMSSKKLKEGKRPAIGVLDAIKEMPVEKWKYKDGVADGGEHVGPYAEDFQKATGLGDGQSINVVDAVGVNMGATKELAQQVDKLSTKIDKMSSGKPKRRSISVLEAA